MNFRRKVLPETREALKRHFPAAFDRPDYARFLGYLLFSTFEGKNPGEEGRLVIDRLTLAQIVDKLPQVKQGNYAVRDFLEEFQRDVMPLDIKSSHHNSSRARTVKRPEWPALTDVLLAELSASYAVRQERGVYLDTGKKPPKRPREELAAQTGQRLALTQQIEDSLDPGHPANELLKYLNHQPETAIRSCVKRNLEAARQAVLHHPTMDASTREYNLLTLYAVEQDPVPLYKPSTADRTVRIFPARTSYLSLTKEIRKTLLSGCYEFDLVSAQLMLATHIWDIPEVKNAMQGYWHLAGPWLMFAYYAGLTSKVPVPHFAPPEIIGKKPVFKRAIYTLLYGGGLRTVQNTLVNGVDGVAGITPAQAKQFLEHEVIKGLLNGQQRRRSQIEADGGMTTVFGKHVLLSRERDSGSLMAEEMQAYELFMLLPAVKYLMERGKDEVSVLAWQHDGFTLHLKNASKRTTIINQLQNSVRHRAEVELRMPVRPKQFAYLEYEKL